MGMNLTDLERRIRTDKRKTHAAMIDRMENVGIRAAWSAWKQDVLFLQEDGTIGNVRLCPYSAPFDHPDEPLIYRFHVNNMVTHVPVRARVHLTGEAHSSARLSTIETFYNPRGEKLELSCLPSEVSTLAGWLPSWILDQSATAPLPIGADHPVRVYCWTLAASEEYERWREIRGLRSIQGVEHEKG